MLNLAKFRKLQEKGLSDYLNYSALIKEGVLVGKNDSLTGCFAYTPFDTHSLTYEQRSQFSEVINHRLKELGNGWTIQTDLIRYGVDDYHSTGIFHDDINRNIELERKSIVQHKGYQFKNSHLIYLTWTPPSLTKEKLASSVTGYKSNFENNLEKFEARLDRFERDLSDLQMRRVKSYEKVALDGSKVLYDEFLQYLKYSLSGVDTPLLSPVCPAYLDSYLVHEDIVNHGHYLSYGKKNISVIHVDGFMNSDSYPMMFEEISSIDTDFRWNTRFITMDTQDALSTVKLNRKKWSQQIISFKDQILNNANARQNLDAVQKTSESDIALSQINSGETAFGYFTSTIVLARDNIKDLEHDVQFFTSALTKIGLQTRVEEINLFEAYLGSLPSHSMYNIRRPILNTRNLSHIIPFTGYYKGLKQNPCPLFPKNSSALMQALTPDGGLFNFNLHHDDLGHTLICAPGGAGKSFILSLLSSQFLRYENSQVFMIDNRNSALALALACGSHFDVSAYSDFSLAPLANLYDEADILWATSWILDIARLQGVDASQDDKVLVESAMRRLLSSDDKTLSAFYYLVGSDSIKFAIKPYLKEGALGSILDSSFCSINDSRLQAFEMFNILQLGGMEDNDKYLLPTLSVIFRQIEKKLDGRPTLITIDECWMALKNEVFSNRLQNWLVTLRRANCSVVLATTNLTHFINSSIADEITTLCKTKIFPPNSEANLETQKDYYKFFGLNDAQINLIAHANAKSDYYYFSSEGSRLFYTGRGHHAKVETPYHNAFLGSSSESYATRIKSLYKQYGKEWTTYWVRERNS